MRYRPLGTTGVRVSAITLGTATFGAAPLADDVPRVVGRALEVGVNAFDTANSYGNQSRFDRPGAPPAEQRESAEELLGRALSGHRDEVLISSKVMERVGPGVNDGGADGGGLSRRHILAQVEASLRRLRTDHLDLYYAHHPDPATPLEETLSAFDTLVMQGKVRYVALSTFPAWQTVEVMWTCDRRGLTPPVCLQLPYSLSRREVEREQLPAARRLGLGVIAFSALGAGLLAGREARERPVSGLRRFGMTRTFTPAQEAVADALESCAASWDLTAPVAALAWLLSRDGVVSAVIGAETPDEVEDCARAADVDLDAGQVRVLDEASTDVV